MSDVSTFESAPTNIVVDPISHGWYFDANDESNPKPC